MNNKAQKFKRLIDNDSDYKRIFEIASDNEKETLFRTKINVTNQSMSSIVSLTSHPYSYIQTLVLSGINNPNKTDYLLQFMNDLNSKSRMATYTFTDNSILLNIPLVILEDSDFNPDLPINTLQLMIDILEQDYPKFMKIIWS